MMKKLIFMILLVLGINLANADSSLYVSTNCSVSGNTLVCNNFRDIQVHIDTLLTKFMRNQNNLKNRLQDLQAKLTLLKLQYIGNGKYSKGVEFVFEYIDYKINQKLTEITQTSTQTLQQDRQPNDYQPTQDTSTTSSTSTNNGTVVDTQSPDKRIIPGAEGLLEVARFKFNIKFADANITQLALVNIGSNTATEVNYSNANSLVFPQADQSVSKVYIYDGTGNYLGEGSLIGGFVDIYFSPSAVIPHDQDFVLVIKIKPSNKYDQNSIVNFGVLKPGNAVGNHRTRIIMSNNGDELGGIYIRDWDLVGNPQYLRESVLNFERAAQRDTKINGTTQIFGFDAIGGINSSLVIKEIRLSVFINDNQTYGGGFKLDGNGFRLEINGSRLSTSDAVFLNALGKCSNLNGSQITSSADLTGSTNTQEYCLRIVLDGNYANGFKLTSNTKYSFKVSAEPMGISQYDSISTQRNNGYDNKGIYTYYDLVNTPTTLIWSDDVVDNLTLSSGNRYSDSLINVTDIGTFYLDK